MKKFIPLSQAERLGRLGLCIAFSALLLSRSAHGERDNLSSKADTRSRPRPNKPRLNLVGSDSSARLLAV